MGINKICELPVGDTLNLGVRDEIPLWWVKVSGDNDFILKYVFPVRLPFDGAEPNAPNEYRRENGWNFYPFSNIHRWLNSDMDTSLMHEDVESCRRALMSHEFDSVPDRFIIEDGFLKSFSDFERACLEPREFTVAVPEGARRGHGRTTRVRALVTLPALAEMVQDPGEDLKAEGEYMPALAEAIRSQTMSRILTRSANSENHCVHQTQLRIIWENNTPRNDIVPNVVYPRRHSNILPMVRLRGDVEVEFCEDVSAYRALPFSSAQWRTIMGF